MNISFYTFRKKSNSTKRPYGVAETIYNCNFLDSTDVIHPSIALVVSAKPTAFNYAYIEDLKRYYFINSWEFSGGRWVARMTVDALASWRTDIGKLTMYVERSSHDYDLTVIDNMYPTRDFPTIVKQTVTLPWLISVFDARGSYILGVRSSEFGIGSITYYIMSARDMLVLKNVLFTDISWANLGTEISDGLGKMLFDPMQYIVSCVWLPFTVTSTDPTHGAIKFGWWTLTSGTYQEMDSSGSLVTKTHTFDVYKLLNPIREFKTDSDGNPMFKFTIGNHPQVSRGRYLNSAPYTSHKLYFPPFGEYNIDARLVGGLDSIVVDVTVDCTSGDALAHVWGYLFDGKVQHLTVLQTRFGADINISANNANLGGLIGGVVGSVTSVLKHDFLGAYSSIGDAMSQPLQQTESVGNNGSFAWIFENTAYFISNYFTLVDENLSHNGRPLCAERVIKDIPGYIKCTESEIEIPCTSTELAMISDDMVGGFFYE